jgi:predicted lipoprotein with Yx(FWY)xxD motif
MVKRMVIAIALAATVALVSTAMAVARGSRAKLNLRRTAVGTILVNGGGFTVYAFTRDARDRDRCVSISGCSRAWPLVTTSGRPVAGRGVRSSLIGTISVGHGLQQVTYAGHPLYTYVGDSGPGQTSYVDFSQFGGRWPALSASGGEVR